jgi:hypothetical protein
VRFAKHGLDARAVSVIESEREHSRIVHQMFGDTEMRTNDHAGDRRPIEDVATPRLAMLARCRSAIVFTLAIDSGRASYGGPRRKNLVIRAIRQVSLVFLNSSCARYQNSLR